MHLLQDDPVLANNLERPNEWHHEPSVSIWLRSGKSVLTLDEQVFSDAMTSQLSTSTNNTDYVGGFPWLRWHQTFDVGYVPNQVVPNVFMAVALDLRDDPNK